MTDRERQREAWRRRDARRRERKREGRKLFEVELERWHEVSEFLIESGHLDALECEDTDAMAEAIARFLVSHA